MEFLFVSLNKELVKRPITLVDTLKCVETNDEDTQ